MVKRFTKLKALIISAAIVAGFDLTAAASDRLKVTMIAYPPGDDFYFTIENAARAQAERSNVDLTVQKLPSYDLSAQIAVLNATIATKPHAIIVSPLDPNGLQLSGSRSFSMTRPHATCPSRRRSFPLISLNWGGMLGGISRGWQAIGKGPYSIKERRLLSPSSMLCILVGAKSWNLSPDTSSWRSTTVILSPQRRPLKCGPF
jgi:hypothetical protein